MEYTIYELLFFLFCYSFMGWCVEVIYVSVRTGTFSNRGVFNLPLCLSYGAAMDLLLVLLPTLEGNLFMQGLACMIVTSVCAQLADEVSVRVTGRKLWKSEERSIYNGKWIGLLYTLALSGIAAVIILLIHPVLFFLCSLLPALALKIITLVILGLLIIDFASIVYAAKKKAVSEEMQAVSEGLEEQKRSFGVWLTSYIWHRLRKAYPNLKATDQEEAGYVFARGLCLDKLIWVFFLSALIGDLIETFYVRLTAGIWMSRSSVIYGPFSIVWGFGAVLLTMLLRRLADKEDRYVFLGGFFLGGAYEYMCSVISEVVFGVTFWDYSNMRFNIGGRTNLLFCFFWGILSLVWIKICYPRLSRLIEKIPPVKGKILTWICVALMVCDLVISAMALVRYVERSMDIPAGNAVESFVDYNYPDSMIEWIWPNLHME